MKNEGFENNISQLCGVLVHAHAGSLFYMDSCLWAHISTHQPASKKTIHASEKLYC
jgi:hypothetical protein